MGLGESTLAAVGQWRFTPGTLHGKPVPVLYDLTVDFHLN
jgi:Gram-negative bacterial TonB protein C-terminal